MATQSDPRTENPFYVLWQHPQPPWDRARTEAIPGAKRRYGPAPTCPSCKRFIGMKRWLPPYQIELECWGSQFGDLAFWGCEQVFVSERFKQAFVDADLQGLSDFEPAEVRRVKRLGKLKGKPPEYFYASVSRSETAVDRSASEAEWTHPNPNICSECLRADRGTFVRYRRVALRTETWDGDDVFLPRGGGEIIVSARFREFCVSHQIANAVMIPCESFSKDFYRFPCDQVDWT